MLIKLLIPWPGVQKRHQEPHYMRVRISVRHDLKLCSAPHTGIKNWNVHRSGSYCGTALHWMPENDGIGVARQ